MFKMYFAVLMIFSMGIAKADFYRLKEDPAGNLPADKFYPKGRVLPFGGFGAPGLTNLKRLGFTMAGPAFCEIKQVCSFARRAKQAGLPAAFNLSITYNGKHFTLDTWIELGKNKEKLNWDLIEKDMVRVIKTARSDKEIDDNIGWWVIAAEELRYWRSDEYRYLKLFCKVIRRLDERKRPIWMYIPGHYSLESLQKYTPYLDVIAQGFYPYADKHDRVWMRYWAKNQMDAVKTAPHKVLPGVVPEMFVEPKPENAKMVPAWVRHDVYMPLIYGCKAVVPFTLFHKNNFPSYSKYLLTYSRVARELSHGGLGEVFLFGKRCSKLKYLVVSGPRKVSYRKGKKLVGTYPTIKLADIKHLSGRYALAASSSKKPLKAVLSGFPKEPVRFIDATNGKEVGTSKNGTFKVEFGPWGVVLLRIEKINQE